MNEEIVYRYLAGTATVYEKASLKEWLKDPQNQELFYKFLVRWEQQNPQFIPDVDPAIMRHFNRINQEENETSLETRHQPVWNWRSWAVVASVVTLLGFISWIQRDLWWYQTHINGSNQSFSWLLSDGSRVTLYPNSSLKVPRFGFGPVLREVFLSGEADFSVVHTQSNQPFIVRTNRSLEVLVLGTEFSVVSRKQEAKVLLNRGKVQLRYHHGPEVKELVMQPGDLVLLDNQNRLMQIDLPEPQKMVVFKEHRFDFNETSLCEITHLLSDQFGIKVTIANDSLANWTVSGSFSAQSAEEMLEIITEASNLKYRKEAHGMVIYND